MWKQLRLELEMLARGIGQLVNEAVLFAGRGILVLWSWVRPAVVLTLNVLAALILLFEEWGWRPLSNFLAHLARYPLWAKAELFIAGLPPYGALCALAIPSAVLIPAKLLGVYFLAGGHLISAAVVIFLAKVASTALIGRIFLLTKPALMQIGWFAHAYELFVPWRDTLFARIRESWVWRYGRVVKWRARNYLRGIWVRWQPQLEAVRPAMESLARRARVLAHDMGARIVKLRDASLERLRPPEQH